MLSLFEALFNHAAGCPDLTHWLEDSDLIAEYRQTLSLCQDQSSRLLERLTGEDRALLERCLEHLGRRSEDEKRMLFCQGLAIGLRLGAAALSASE